jgi:capsular polysaccharide biosynthesis protein
VEDERPVYLSRRNAAQRRVDGERELEEVLTARGAMVVSPETLGYEDQVRLFNRHSVFIGWIGSAFHSLLYALPGRTRTSGRPTCSIPPNPSPGSSGWRRSEACSAGRAA